jgi:hypothetical protein
VHMHPTVLVLTFSEGLNVTRAQDVTNYKVIGPSGRAIRIAQAVYDPTRDTVTLTPDERISIHHRYRLEVVGTAPGGVMGNDGIMLDGDSDGSPGTDYVAKLTWRNLVLTPAEARKYDHSSMHLARPAGPIAHRFIGEPKTRRPRSQSALSESQRRQD